jgi:predicted Rossmann fold flavoprotein
VPGTKLRERGALLLTHWGLSGPAILRLSAWGARELHEKITISAANKLAAAFDAEKLAAEFQARREIAAGEIDCQFPNRPAAVAALGAARVLASGIARDTRWAALSGAAQHKLIQQLLRSEFPVTGKSLNKDEFVTCGGVRLSEVNFKTMESKICPGLFFAGEVLDIDGITGGFNFQAAWTTGWIAGRAMAAQVDCGTERRPMAGN